MALANKETLEKLSEKALSEYILDSVVLGTGFVSFGGKHVKFEDVFISCYQSLLNEYKNQSDELRLSNNLEY